MSFSSMLIHTTTITRPTEGFVSGTLQKKISYAAVSSGTKCRIEQLSGEVAITIIGRIPRATHQIFFNAETDIKVNDNMNDGTYDYEAEEVATISSGIAHHIEVVARKK